MLRSALPSSPEARRVLVGTLFSAIGRGLTLPFLLVYLTRVRGLDAGTVGLLVGWMGVITLVLAPFGGSLVDRLGARRVVLPLLFVASLGSVSLAFATNVLRAFLALTVVAIAFAALWAGQNTILASLVEPAERQKTFGLSFTLLNLGIGVGGLIAGAFVDMARPITFQIIYFGDALSFMVPATILLTLPKVGRRVASAGVETVAKVRGGYAEVLRDRSFLRFVLFGLVLSTFGYAQIEVGFTAFSALVAGVPPRVLGWAFAGNTLLIVLAQLFVLRWLQGRSRTRALAICGGFFAVSWAVLAAAGVAGTHGVAVLAVIGVIGCSVIFAMGETLLSPILPVITNALATDALRGRYNAVGSMIFGLSGIVGPVAAGPLIGHGRASLWVAMVIGGSLVASLLALNLRRHLTPAQDGRVDPPLPAPRGPVDAATDPAEPARPAALRAQ
jgi:MFS family permease